MRGSNDAAAQAPATDTAPATPARGRRTKPAEAAGTGQIDHSIRSLWVRMDESLLTSPSVATFRRAIGVGENEALGIFLRLCLHVGRHRADGDLNGLDPRVLAEDWARYAGDAERFADAFHANFCKDGVITGWEERQGKLLVLARANSERVAAFRNRRKVSNADSNITVPELYASTVHGQDSTTDQEPSAAVAARDELDLRVAPSAKPAVSPKPRATKAAKAKPAAADANTSWITPFDSAWATIVMGVLPIGQSLKPLAAVVAALGETAGSCPESLLRWTSYLQHKLAYGPTAAKFLSVHGQYAGGAIPISSGKPVQRVSDDEAKFIGLAYGSPEVAS